MQTLITVCQLNKGSKAQTDCWNIIKLFEQMIWLIQHEHILVITTAGHLQGSQITYSNESHINY